MAKIELFDGVSFAAPQGGLIPSVLDTLMGLAIKDSHQYINEEMLDPISFILQRPANAQDTKKRPENLKTESNWQAGSWVQELR